MKFHALSEQILPWARLLASIFLRKELEKHKNKTPLYAQFYFVYACKKIRGTNMFQARIVK